MSFSENLASLRKSKGLSQEEIADRLGVSRQAISKWENGQALPETANIIKLCEILGVTPNELLGYGERMEQPVEQAANNYNDEEISEKKKWYKTTPFKVFVAVVAALLAVYIIKIVATLGFAGIFMMKASPGEVVVVDESVTATLSDGVATQGAASFSTQGTNGYKVIVKVDFVPDVYSPTYDCSFAFSADGMQTVTAEAEYEGGMWTAQVELEKTSGEIDVVFITDTGYRKVPVKAATICGIDEVSVEWY